MPQQMLTMLMAGRTKSVNVLFVIDVPRNENNCDSRAVMFKPKIERHLVLVTNDVVWCIPTRSKAQETTGRCSRELLIAGRLQRLAGESFRFVRCSSGHAEAISYTRGCVVQDGKTKNIVFATPWRLWFSIRLFVRDRHA